MSDKLDDYYLRQISLDLRNQIYKDPWGGVIIKNEIDILISIATSTRNNV